MKYIATADPGIVVMVDNDGSPLWAIGEKCSEWPDYLAWQAQAGNKLFPAQPSEFHEFTGVSWEIADVDGCRAEIQRRNRLACRTHILAAYPAEIQLSMNAGIYSVEVIAEYQDFLAAMVAEENRVFDLLSLAADPTTVAAPNWPEV